MTIRRKAHHINFCGLCRCFSMIATILILFYCYSITQEETKTIATIQPHNFKPSTLTSLPKIRSDLREIAELYLGKYSRLQAVPSSRINDNKPPNFLLMVFDDSGYGDLGVNVANPTHTSNTPHIDALALHGVRFTDFYVTASICTPSRASLLTGRYGPRTGMTGHVSPKSTGGLPASELTIAAHLKPLGYDNIILGKWHLGHVRPHDPVSHGFDEWLGIPFSNDMGCTDEPLGATNPNMPATPSRFACPPRSPQQHALLPKDKHSTSEDGGSLYTQLVNMFDRAMEFLIQGNNDNIDKPVAVRSPVEYSANKWVTMGKGDPTVLPLFHGCRRPDRKDKSPHLCNRAVAMTLASLRPFCGVENATVSPKSATKSARKKKKNPQSGIREFIREQPTSLWRLTDRLVSRASSFISQHAEPDSPPFFLYFPLIHTHIPHTPHKSFIRQALQALNLEDSGETYEVDEDLFSATSQLPDLVRETESAPSAKKKKKTPIPVSYFSKTARATYAAAMREGDDIVGQMVGALQDTGVAENTLTIVMSDNGPWLVQEAMGGSPTPFRGGKFSSNEGGVRVFCVFHWPRVFGAHAHLHHKTAVEGRLLQGDVRGVTSSLVTSTLDILPTFLSLAKGRVPIDRELDGSDLSSFLHMAGEYRLLHRDYFESFHSNHTDTGSDDRIQAENAFLQQHSEIISRGYLTRAVLVQEGAGFGAMRLGQYKVMGLGKLSDRILSQGLIPNSTLGLGHLVVYDVDEDKAEKHTLHNVDYYLKRPNKRTAENRQAKHENELVTLTRAEFAVVVVYIRETLWHDIRRSFRSDASSRQTQLSAALPCAVEFENDVMCQKCLCDDRPRIHWPGRNC